MKKKPSKATTLTPESIEQEFHAWFSERTETLSQEDLIEAAECITVHLDGVIDCVRHEMANPEDDE